MVIAETQAHAHDDERGAKMNAVMCNDVMCVAGLGSWMVDGFIIGCEGSSIDGLMRLFICVYASYAGTVGRHFCNTAAQKKKKNLSIN